MNEILVYMFEIIANFPEGQQKSLNFEENRLKRSLEHKYHNLAQFWLILNSIILCSIIILTLVCL